jgi:hypothetical protein
VLHGRLVARDPSTWTHHELLDFFEQEFAAIDGERAFPEPLRGKDVMGMGVRPAIFCAQPEQTLMTRLVALDAGGDVSFEGFAVPPPGREAGDRRSRAQGRSVSDPLVGEDAEPPLTFSSLDRSAIACGR